MTKNGRRIRFKNHPSDWSDVQSALEADNKPKPLGWKRKVLYSLFMICFLVAVAARVFTPTVSDQEFSTSTQARIEQFLAEDIESEASFEFFTPTSYDGEIVRRGDRGGGYVLYVLAGDSPHQRRYVGVSGPWSILFWSFDSSVKRVIPDYSALSSNEKESVPEADRYVAGCDPARDQRWSDLTVQEQRSALLGYYLCVAVIDDRS